MSSKELTPEIVESVIQLAKTSLAFGRISRKTYHEDGERAESDTDHTVMLGLIACAFAKEFSPELDLGKIAQFALVHDLVEVYAGDTVTGTIQKAEEIREKEAREHAAFVRLQSEYMTTFPWIIETIEEYEALQSREARFVKILDKVLPKITHYLNRGVVMSELGLNKSGMVDFHTHQKEKLLNTYAKDQPEVMALYTALSELLEASLFVDT